MGDKNRSILIKYSINILLIILGAFVITMALIHVQNKRTQEEKEKENHAALTQLIQIAGENADNAQTLAQLFHRNNTSKVDDIAKLLDTDMLEHLEADDIQDRFRYFADVCSRAELDDVYVIWPDGVVELGTNMMLYGQNIISAGVMSEDQLEQIELGTDTSVCVESGGSSVYYYGSKLLYQDKTFYLVVGVDDAYLREKFLGATDINSIYGTVELDSEEIFLVIEDGQIIFSKSEEEYEYTSYSAEEIGLSSDIYTEEFSGFENILEDTYYITSKRDGNLTYVLGQSQEKLFQDNKASWQWFVTVFVVLAVICMAYTVIIRNYVMASNDLSSRRFLFNALGSDIYINLAIVRRMTPLILICILVIFGFSFYEQTLIGLSKAISLSGKVTQEVENELLVADEISAAVENYYRDELLSKARLIALYLEENPEALNEGRNQVYREYDSDGKLRDMTDSEGNLLLAVANSSILEELCASNEFNDINLFDDQGRIIVTSANGWNFTLSMDPEDQSYAFRQILEGKSDSVVQEEMENEAGNISQYIGVEYYYYTTSLNGNTEYVSIYDYVDDQNGVWEGAPITKHRAILQVDIDTDEREQILEASEYDYLVANMTRARGIYLMLFTSDEDHTVVYSPVETSIGKTAEEIGLTQETFANVYNGSEQINGVSYFVNIQEHSGYYVATIIPESGMFEARLGISLHSSAISLFFLLLVMVLVVFTLEGEEELVRKYAERYSRRLEDAMEGGSMFMILLPSGRRSLTKQVDYRWNGKTTPWSQKVPEQKLYNLLSGAFSILTVYLVINLFRAKTIYDENSVITYILNRNWEKGINIFAITSCIIVCIMVVVLVYLISIPIRLLTVLFGTKTETIGQLTRSVIKYGSAIVTLFYCLYLLGFDSTSLIASAGILSLIIGLGAQSLIKDIIAGMFIIFEGEFRIGDIVSVDDFRGQVLEIGLRTTKIMSDDQNVKIFNNNDITGVINMTRINTIFLLKVPISSEVPPDTIEKVFKEELPLIKDNIPHLAKTPTYQGVIGFEKNNIAISIKASCTEQDITRTKNRLNKEIVDILKRRGIPMGELPRSCW